MVFVRETDPRDAQEAEKKRLCFECVAEPYFRDEIKRQGAPGLCSYCDAEEERNCYTMRTAADRVKTVFAEHFYRTATDMDGLEYMMHKDPESTYCWSRDGQPVTDAIQELADVKEEVAEDIQCILEEDHFDFDSAAMGDEGEFGAASHYAESGIDTREWNEQWDEFREELKFRFRFFSPRAADLLKTVFDGIDTFLTGDKRPIIVTAGPDSSYPSFFRARVFYKTPALHEALKWPDVELGPPPPDIAPAGRMNACGISVFYGATAPDVALGEVRPPVGGSVVIGRFDVVRPLRLLDLTSLPDVVAEASSLFDPQHLRRLKHAAFLQSLSTHLTQAVLPGDQDLDYLPTQVIADFLSGHPTLDLDGILFPSVQSGKAGLNVVLFQKASRVSKLQIPNGTKFTVQTGQFGPEEGDIEYSVTENVPPAMPDPATTSPSDLDSGAAIDQYFNRDHRKDTLRVDEKTLRVHFITSVRVGSESWDVSRRRWSMPVGEPPF
jgi:hypothetical protein